MYKFDFEKIKTDSPLFLYFLSTLFMVFFSVHAIHSWPDRWAQTTISLACILTALLVLIKNIPSFTKNKNFPKELKLVVLIMILGAFNIFFSEDRLASLKGMSLFLMSGLLIFVVTFFLFKSKENQALFLRFFSTCFVVLVFCGLFEFFQGIIISEKQILLFSSNPIPAGSLLILLSTGPLLLLAKTKLAWKKTLLSLSLLLGILVVILIGQRGPILALLVMGFIWAATRSQGLWIFTLTILILVGAGYQSRDKIPLHYKNQLLKKDTVLVRLEFYNVAGQIVKDKPLFGVGFSAPITKYITKDYEPKFYPADSKHTFPAIITGVETFDNMALFFLAQTGLLFTGAYVCLVLYLIRNLTKKNNNGSADIKLQNTLLLTVLIGFAVHSMTFDSLRYPHLNWIFHSLLGLMANNSLFHQEKFCQEDEPQQEGEIS
jgi:O-antigen ligase